MTKIMIHGFCGRMGTRIAYCAGLDEHCTVVAGLEKSGHEACGTQREGITVTDDIAKAGTADVLIDFTLPPGTMSILEPAREHKLALVIGTTGLTEEQIGLVKRISNDIPVVYSPNMSVGVNVLFSILETAAAKLPGYRVRIREAHHVHKKDAPSGTAKRLAAIVEEQTGKPVEDIESIREGEIVGDHDIVLESDVDTIVLRHAAKTRDIFAQGAVTAAKWIKGKPAGLYSMKDVLGI